MQGVQEAKEALEQIVRQGDKYGDYRKDGNGSRRVVVNGC
jgi:hypothetical protein